MSMLKIARTTVAATLMLYFLTSCTGIKLAPEYDKAIAGGLVSVNQKMMEFFASTSSGVEAANYDKRDSQYNEIIGGLDALIIQVESRPAPPDSTAKRIVDQILSRKASNADTSNSNCKDESPTICALKHMSEGIAKMRSIDKKQGVTADETAIYKKMIVLDMDTALTYESLLER